MILKYRGSLVAFDVVWGCGRVLGGSIVAVFSFFAFFALFIWRFSGKLTVT